MKSFLWDSYRIETTLTKDQVLQALRENVRPIGRFLGMARGEPPPFEGKITEKGFRLYDLFYPPPPKGNSTNPRGISCFHDHERGNVGLTGLFEMTPDGLTLHARVGPSADGVCQMGCPPVGIALILWFSSRTFALSKAFIVLTVMCAIAFVTLFYWMYPRFVWPGYGFRGEAATSKRRLVEILQTAGQTEDAVTGVYDEPFFKRGAFPGMPF